MDTPGPVRKRMKRREIPGGVRFITFSCERRLPLLGTAQARDAFVRCMVAARLKFKFELIAWVVMPEHAHLLLRSTGERPLDRALASMKIAAQQRLLWEMRHTADPLLPQVTRPDGRPRIWQKGGGFDRNVRGDPEMQREIRYIHRNPVEAELAERPEQWPWSSARFWIARHRGEQPARGEVRCDWPPGDPRAWAMWQGFV